MEKGFGKKSIVGKLGNLWEARSMYSQANALAGKKSTFHYSFYIFHGPIICSPLKISIPLSVLSWKYFALIETKSLKQQDT